MIPILYESNETEFATHGLGSLAEAIQCTVQEQRNGIFELEMTYPQTGIRFSDLLAGNIIYAIPSPYREAQPFRIYKVTKPLNGNVTVYANHISYDLNKIPVKPFSASSAKDAMVKIKENCAIVNNFLFETNKNLDAQMAIEVPQTARACLGGVHGSILDTYGGEYEWDKFTVRLKVQRGKDSGVVIKYGKNLTGLTQEGDTSNLVTGIYPFWFNDGVLATCDPPIIYAEGATGETAVPVDLTDKFEEKPTSDQLKQAAESYINANDIGVPDVSVSMEFVDLSRMTGYEDLALLEKCDLCDTLTVDYPQAGIYSKAKIVSIETDVLLERYNKMEIGTIRPNIAQTIANQQTQITQNSSPSAIQQAISSATGWITGGRGGYVVFRQNEDGQPDEILIMDSPDIDAAVNVWRWNKNGWGHSSNGYNGPFTMAATIDGGFVADFITAGQMRAERISGGTIEGKIVAKNLEMQGGKIQITTESYMDNIIKMISGMYSSTMTPSGFSLESNDGVNRVSPVYLQMGASSDDAKILLSGPNGTGYFSNSVRAEYFQAGSNNENGITGTFKDQNGNTIKVVGGIITGLS